MTASDSAEAFLIVIKRIGKFLLWLLAGAIAILLAIFGLAEWKKYSDNKPYRATSYAEISLGDTQNEILYSLGPPPNFIGPTQSVLEIKEAEDIKEDEKNLSFSDSKEWLYTDRQGRIDVAFDKPGGRVISIACYSDSYFLCPTIFGIHDGSNENDVISHLGQPSSERIDGVAKIIRYSQYNLTLYLAKRQVYMLKVSENAD